jgi:uncharacterized protein YigA (DUF484 family)
MAEAVAKNKEAAQPLDEERVAEWLEANPGFFARHPGVLESVDLRHASGGAVSLIERQVDALRAKNIQLESRLQQLVEAARENESRVVKVQKLARTLLRAPTLATVVSGLRKVLREDFAIDEVFVGVHAPKLLRQDIDGLTRIDAKGAIARTWDDFFRTRLAECGPISAERAKLLFPKAEALPTSAAIVPLEKQHNLGMLALGAVDAQRFQPKQGRIFLDMTAELVAAALRARLG